MPSLTTPSEILRKDCLDCHLSPKTGVCSHRVAHPQKPFSNCTASWTARDSANRKECSIASLDKTLP